MQGDAAHTLPHTFPHPITPFLPSPSLALLQVQRRLRSALDDTNDPVAREGALAAIRGLSKSVGKAAEPYIVPLVPSILDRMSDKVAAVREAAVEAASAVAASLCPHAVPLVMPMLYEAMGSKQWQTKEGALKLLKQFAALAPAQVAAALPEIVPTAGECLIDPREQVGVVCVLGCGGGGRRGHHWA